MRACTRSTSRSALVVLHGFVHVEQAGLDGEARRRIWKSAALAARQSRAAHGARQRLSLM
jgi:hypothetical protein